MTIIAPLPIRGKTIQVEMLDAWTTDQGKVALVRAEAEDIADVLGLSAAGPWSGKQVTFYVLKSGVRTTIKTNL
jgi:hypothetical protein